MWTSLGRMLFCLPHGLIHLGDGEPWWLEVCLALPCLGLQS
jgi:hypothetical protein